MHGLWPCVPVYSLLDELVFVSDLLAGLSLLVLVLVLVLAVLDSLLVVLPDPLVVLEVLEVLGDPAASVDFELSDFGLSTFSLLDFELLALSFLYKPPPLKVIPTGVKTFFTRRGLPSDGCGA